MTDERWRQRIQVEPDILTAHASADRARRKALARFDQVGRTRSLLRWPAIAITGAFALILWMTMVSPPVEAPKAESRVQFVLSDGTKVQWVFSDRFAL